VGLGRIEWRRNKFGAKFTQTTDESKFIKFIQQIIEDQPNQSVYHWNKGVLDQGIWAVRVKSRKARLCRQNL
jgi:hypothetical protein